MKIFCSSKNAVIILKKVLEISNCHSLHNLKNICFNCVFKHKNSMNISPREWCKANAETSMYGIVFILFSVMLGWLTVR